MIQNTLYVCQNPCVVGNVSRTESLFLAAGDKPVMLCYISNSLKRSLIDFSHVYFHSNRVLHTEMWEGKKKSQKVDRVSNPVPACVSLERLSAWGWLN